jgi:hypothetical protein
MPLGAAMAWICLDVDMIRCLIDHVHICATSLIHSSACSRKAGESQDEETSSSEKFRGLSKGQQSHSSCSVVARRSQSDRTLIGHSDPTNWPLQIPA